MGMTIDMAKLNLYAIQHYYNEDLQDCYVYVGFDEEDNETVNFAIEIMRKYQKIEQIIHDDWIKGVNSGATLNRIEEVMKDGKSGN